MFKANVKYWVELNGLVEEGKYDEPYVEIRIHITLLGHTYMYDEEIPLSKWIEIVKRGYIDSDNKQGRVEL